LGQLGNTHDVFMGMYIERHEMRCVNPGKEVFHVLDETAKVEIGKSGENSENEWRRIRAPQFWGGRNETRNAVDVKLLELGCCRQSSGEVLW